MAQQAGAGRRYLRAFVSGFFVAVPVTVTVLDRVACVARVEGASMQVSVSLFQGDSRREVNLRLKMHLQGHYGVPTRCFLNHSYFSITTSNDISKRADCW